HESFTVDFPPIALIELSAILLITAWLLFFSWKNASVFSSSIVEGVPPQPPPLVTITFVQYSFAASASQAHATLPGNTPQASPIGLLGPSGKTPLSQLVSLTLAKTSSASLNVKIPTKTKLITNTMLASI